MAVQTIMLDVPDDLYARLKRRAERTHRSIESEVLEVVAAAVPPSEDLPADLAEAVSALAVLDDAALWSAARSHLDPAAAAEMERLHIKRQRVGLSEAESQTLATLVREYERFMLLRANAAALLRERGHDVAPLLATA